MRVTVKLHGPFRDGRFREEVRDVPAGATARTVAELLQIAARAVGIVLIGGAHAGLDDALAEGDVVSLLPYMGGG
jgi:molybdopterin converting factor small subunit